MKHDRTVGALLDKLARLTGVPQLQERFGKPRRRPLRWLPLLVIIVATAAGGVIAILPNLQTLGIAMMALCFSLSSLVTAIGPLRPWGSCELIDERDRQERSRAYLFALSGILFVSIASLLCLVAVLITTDLARERIAVFAVYAALYQIVLISTLPTLYVSWLSSPLRLDSDDDSHLLHIT